MKPSGKAHVTRKGYEEVSETRSNCGRSSNKTDSAQGVQLLFFVCKEKVGYGVPERRSKAQDQARRQSGDGEIRLEIPHLRFSKKWSFYPRSYSVGIHLLYKIGLCSSCLQCLGEMGWIL